MIKCNICDKEFNGFVGLATHAFRAHKLSSKEYYDKFYKKDGEGFCRVCFNPTSFRSIKSGYNKCCSRECSNKDLEKFAKIEKTNLERYGAKNVFASDYAKEMIKNTNLEKYGVENAAKSKIIKDKIKQTNLERYGVSCVFQNGEIKNKIKSIMVEKYGVENCSQSQEIVNKKRSNNLKKYGVSHPNKLQEFKDKVKLNNLKKYGVDHPLKTSTIQEKIQNTNLERYGYKYIAESENIKNKIKQTCLNKYGVENFGLIKKKYREDFELSNECTLVHSLVLKYGQGWYKTLDLDKLEYKGMTYIKNEDINLIKEYANRVKSFFENEIFQFICSIFSNEIYTRYRKIISPLELDIYIPEKKLAIECNGIYWHSVNTGTNKDYHLIKTRLCEELGIRLIHISEWEWHNKQDICKSIISGALGKYENRIYARKCEIREVSYNESVLFLNENHIQGGNIPSKWRYGLYYNGELVQIITLGQSRFKKGEIELLRMCSKLNTQVIGGFSKLLKHLPDEISEIYSYIDRGKFDGKGYFNTGWEYINETSPNYHYYKGNEKYTRNQCQKYKLKKFLGEDNFDENLTESENMIKNNYLKVYDSGNIKVRLKL